jgi:hypothetical protein
MPQISKGRKFVFGWSLVNGDYSVRLPDMAVSEYEIASEGKVIVISSSKTTGSFCVSRNQLINKSKLKVILEENSMLRNYETREGEFVKYKGRLYCWLSITNDGILKLSEVISNTLSIKKGDRLLSVRRSNIAFVMGVKGPLIKLANNYKGKIQSY